MMKVKKTNGLEEMMNEVIVKPMINRYLLAMIGVQSLVEDWWNIPNKNWNGKTPDEIYQSGPDGRLEVYRYVTMCAEGGGS